MPATTSLETQTGLSPRVLRALPSQPLVSVLVGNYNYAKYLGQSIESVQNQSYRNWELIICDDGSTDDSVAVIEKYANRDGRVRLVRKQNGGHPSALNAAFAECRGEIICLLDSDDLYLPSKLQQVVSKCQAQPQAGLVVHRVIRVDQNRNRQGVWPLSDLPEGWFGPQLLKGGGILGYLPPTSGLIVRREIAEALFPLRTEPPFRSSPDQIVMRLAPLITNVAAIPEAMAEYRLHNSNSYAQHSVTADSVGKELTLSKALWGEQRRFLAAIDSQLATQFEPFEASPHCAFLQFLDAKLRNLKTARAYHAEYVAVSRRSQAPRWFRFWRMSLYLPGPLFRVAVNMLLGQSALKQAIARFRRLA